MEETQTAFSSKKPCGIKAAEVEFSKDPNFCSSVSMEGVSKATKQGLPKSVKKVEPPSKMTAARGLPRKYSLQAGLQMKVLETENQQLRCKLTEAEGTIKDLKEEKGLLMLEIEKLKKSQEDCMTILARRNIDPVTGSKILEEEEKAQEYQKHTQKLVEELKQFNRAAVEEREARQAWMAKGQAARAEMQQQAMKKRAFHQAQMRKSMAILKEVDQLLEM
ncbi:small kinetochore-associated protein-like [Indicator indicator]|uniref:small kinetochore-associated protein n=1 Tax=Indicator indicator TaxID=1002788 RepID=UPI0023DEFD3C|nr:small kinetochore-associated protein [Indicator indicator]XP_054246579.1 small kinetochore-associated protein-like [Indicator indicator]